MSEYQKETFGIIAQFPNIFAPRRAPFPDAVPKYGVSCNHSEMPHGLQAVVPPNKYDRVFMASQIAPVLSEMSGQDSRLKDLIELATYSRVLGQLLTLQHIQVVVQPWVSHAPFAYNRTFLGLETVGLYVLNLEDRYKAIMAERLEELKDWKYDHADRD